MSLDDVHTDEMPKPYDDPWPAGDPVVARLAEDLRIVASGPAPEPRPGLVAVMALGAARPLGPEPGRRKMLVKTLLGSLAAKVALGVGVAAASVTAAGATGVLPDAAQHAVASVVSATTPFVLPDPSTTVTPAVDASTDPTTTSSTSSTTSTTVSEGDAVTPGSIPGIDDTTGQDRAENHGACVSAVAQDKSLPESHGNIVSSVARSDCGKTTTSSTVGGGSTTTSSTSTSTTVAGLTRGSGSGPGNSGNSGNSGSAGHGNSGNGGSGKG